MSTVAVGREAMRIDDATALIEATFHTVCGNEEVALDRALGRVLAADLVSAIAVPKTANAAVDGYAIRHVDLSPAAETVLPLVGRAAAGHPSDRLLAPGTAMRIFTGAPMPEGADTVVMQEDCRLDAGTVILRPGIAGGANCRHAGEDVGAHSLVLTAGQRLRPQDIAIIAAIGGARVGVRRRLRVALCSTGDELVDPGTSPGPGRIFDSNRPMLNALLLAAGCTVTDLGILPDRTDRIAACLAAAGSTHDLIVSSGGVSVGEEDHVKDALGRIGRLDFWRLAIRPGRPVALGEVGATPIVCLPGNPVAVMVTYLAIVRPLLARLGGALPAPPQHFPVRAGFAMAKRAGRREFVRVRLDGDATPPVARRFPREGAGILSSLVFADGLVDLPEALEGVAEGDTVSYLPFGGLFS